MRRALTLFSSWVLLIAVGCNSGGSGPGVAPPPDEGEGSATADAATKKGAMKKAKSVGVGLEPPAPVAN